MKFIFVYLNDDNLKNATKQKPVEFDGIFGTYLTRVYTGGEMYTTTVNRKRYGQNYDI